MCQRKIKNLVSILCVSTPPPFFKPVCSCFCVCSLTTQRRKKAVQQDGFSTKKKVCSYVPLQTALRVATFFNTQPFYINVFSIFCGIFFFSACTISARFVRKEKRIVDERAVSFAGRLGTPKKIYRRGEIII